MASRTITRAMKRAQSRIIQARGPITKGKAKPKAKPKAAAKAKPKAAAKAKPKIKARKPVAKKVAKKPTKPAALPSVRFEYKTISLGANKGKFRTVMISRGKTIATLPVSESRAAVRGLCRRVNATVPVVFLG
jgi:hypothetical protein